MEVVIELKFFIVPECVHSKTITVKDHTWLKEAQGYSLSVLNTETLEKLCDEFAKEVFKKAGKQRKAKG